MCGLTATIARRRTSSPFRTRSCGLSPPRWPGAWRRRAPKACGGDRPASLSAYECVLRGNALPVGDPVTDAAAHQLFEQAIALDPDYARAYAQLAISHVNRWEDAMSELK